MCLHLMELAPEKASGCPADSSHKNGLGQNKKKKNTHTDLKHTDLKAGLGGKWFHRAGRWDDWGDVKSERQRLDCERHKKKDIRCERRHGGEKELIIRFQKRG